MLKLDDDGVREWETVPTGEDGANLLVSVLTASDGYVAGGFSSNDDGSFDARLLKYDTEGTSQFDETYGSRQGWAVVPAVGEGYLLGGTNLDGQDADAWIQRVGTDGSDRWSETFDAGGGELFTDGVAIDDGYVFAGKSVQSGVDNGYIVEVDTGGSEQWSDTYEGDERGELNAIHSVDDGYVAAGMTWTTDTGDGTDADDGWVLKVDDSGTEQWSTSIDNDDGDSVDAIAPSDGGGYYLVGETGYNATDSGVGEVWVVELDAEGNEVDSTTYGGDGTDAGTDIVDGDGSYLVTGETTPSGADFTQGWIMKAVDPIAGVPGE